MTSPGRASRTILSSALLAALLMLAGGVAGQDRGLDRLEALGRTLRSQPLWQTTYDQVYLAAESRLPDEASGQVWVAWPDHALFRYTEPTGRAMGLDGRTVRLLDLATPSCDDHLLNDVEWAKIPLAAVLDPQAAVDHFAIVEKGERGVVLIPRDEGGIARVELTLGDDHMPIEVVVIDPLGATNTLVFGSWNPAKKVPGGAWLPEPPKGLDCVADPGTEE
jgi:hypothetical protein